MTASELRYLIAVHELGEENGVVKLTMIANKMQVSKVSAFKAVERLETGGYIIHDCKKICLTEKGKDELSEYIIALRFIEHHLECHCGTPQDIAYHDALSAVCTFSDTSRHGIVRFIQAGGKMEWGE